MAKTQSLHSIYQLKVTLKDSRPIIWRRLRILSTDTLEDLHLALQIVMGWTDSHLHEFVKGRDHYGALDDYCPPELLDESEYPLAQVLKKEKDKLSYEYDFGDGWRHEVELEKILPYKTDAILPVCLKGARACPPEDVGGLYGYERFLKIIRNPKHPEHEETMEWAGDEFDPKHFDLAETNGLLREYCDGPPEGTSPDTPDTENFSKDLFKPLNAEEFEYLDHFLLYRVDEDADVEDGEEGILDMSELDGFFTAIVSSPALIQPSQWLPVLWGRIEPEWESEKEFQLILVLMMRHMNSIAACLLEDPESFEPVFMQSNMVKTEIMIVDEWCEGYLRGVALAAEQWNAAEQDMGILLAPIRAFTTETDWRGHDLKDKELLNLQKAIAPNAREIHAYWLARRQEQAPASQQPVRSTAPRVGRNDPCPCGSGKKYKKCCLH